MLIVIVFSFALTTVCYVKHILVFSVRSIVALKEQLSFPHCDLIQPINQFLPWEQLCHE